MLKKTLHKAITAILAINNATDVEHLSVVIFKQVYA